jgi:hypothetical protein
MSNGSDGKDTGPTLEERVATLEARLSTLSQFVGPAFWNHVDRLYDRTSSPRDALTCLACGGVFERKAMAVRTDTCVFGGGRLDRHECPACGCVFGPEKYLDLPGALVAADMAHLYSTYSEGDSSAEEMRAFHMMNPKPGGLYLCWGSGAWSHTVEKLRAEGHDVWGFEPFIETGSPHVVRTREEIRAKFDGVFSNNVLEHMQDPAAQFREFHHYLKPGGVMCHATPCYDWLYAFTRFHVFFPLGTSIDRLAARTGYEVIGVERDGAFNGRLLRSLQP